MFQLIKNYMNKLTLEDVNNYAVKNGISLSKDELMFTYTFIKKNFEALYANPNIDLSKYKAHYTEENFNKIIKLVNDAKIKYAKYL